jgi:RNA polymerase sigma-70 factor (ECF subfamily)
METSMTESEAERWVLACIPGLRMMARRLTWNPADAADLVQATCLRALEKWRHFISGTLGDFKNWLCTIMYNLHHDALRKRRRELLSAELDERADDPRETHSSAWRVVEEQSVAEAVRALPETLQGPYVLFAVDHLSYADIAARLNMPLRTVGTRIFRARARLRATLQDQAPAADHGAVVVKAVKAAKTSMKAAA